MIDVQMVMNADAESRLIERFGPGVSAWCRILPGVVEQLTTRWALHLQEAIPSGTSRTFRCARDDGTPVILKVTPDHDIAATEAVALHAWADCPHVVDLMETDLTAGALLLEAIEPGTPLSRTAKPLPHNEIAQLLVCLRAFETGAGTDRLPQLPDRIEFLFALTEERRNRLPAADDIPAHLVTRSRRAAQALAAKGPNKLVHGDLHPANVLQGGPTRGLVAIDPRPCIGDPDFDAIDWALADATTMEDVHSRIAFLAEHVPDLNPTRVWHWCEATAIIIAIQRLRFGMTDPQTQTLLELAGL
jgi:streptomycin 6-kinase